MSAAAVSGCGRGQGLLIGLEYDPSQMHGPPFTVPEEEVRRLFERLAMREASGV